MIKNRGSGGRLQPHQICPPPPPLDNEKWSVIVVKWEILYYIAKLIFPRPWRNSIELGQKYLDIRTS